MEPITNRTEVPTPARQVPPVAKSADASSAEESAPATQISGDTSLADKVAASGPDLRADEIERGKRLVSDSNYPSDEILGKLAETILHSDDFRGAL